MVYGKVVNGLHVAFLGLGKGRFELSFCLVTRYCFSSYETARGSSQRLMRGAGFEGRRAVKRGDNLKRKHQCHGATSDGMGSWGDLN